jgi:spermidine synthase
VAEQRRVQPNTTASDGPTGARGRLLCGLLFASGAAGLIYQVLWMKQLGLLFGNTAQATSTTLAAFFAGLAAGGWFWGRRAGRSRNPLRLYAGLEFGIAITALVYYGILELFYAVYPAVYQSLGDGAALIGTKLALALLLIFPPAFCMGGTLPAVGQHLISRPAMFGRTAALLYGVNAFGAAVGVIATVFLLIPTFGFAISYALAIALSVAVGVIAFATPANEAPGSEQPDAHPAPGATQTQLPPIPGAFGPWSIAALCFVSGFSVLALEVIWTRMFAQVHSNSVYAFAVMLTVALTGLAAERGSVPVSHA